MSLAITIKCIDGIVLASDTRLSVEVRNNNYVFMNHFDSAKKLFSLGGVHNHVGILVYGLVSIKNRAIHNFIPELTLELGHKRLLTILDYAKRISSFFQNKWEKMMPLDYNGPEVCFVVCGYDPLELYGKIFHFALPFHGQPKPNMEGDSQFGLTFGGDVGIINRLVGGFDPLLFEDIKKNQNISPEGKNEILKDMQSKYRLQIPFDIFSLQDAINLARTLISTTISLKKLTIGPDVVGGDIEVMVIRNTTDVEFISKKEIV